VKNPYFGNISKIKSNEKEVKVNQNPQLPEPEPLCQEEKMKFIAQAKIHVPIEEKYLCEDLLCKHHDFFSKDKQDVGNAIIF
jgi:hypothetical protein